MSNKNFLFYLFANIDENFSQKYALKKKNNLENCKESKNNRDYHV